MKILVAINSSENPNTLAKTTLRWAARAGFNMRVFIPDDSQLEEYIQAIASANYLWHLDLPSTVIVSDMLYNNFAQLGNYDLIVILPDDLRKWDKKATHDLNPYHYARDIGAARSQFSQDPTMMEKQFDNGAVMRRL